MTIIGITGPTGAGKTTVLRVLERLGGAVIDCDAVYHELTRSCAPMLAELRTRFGNEIFDENGVLRRKALGAIVFRDEAALADLNEITHRYIKAELRWIIGQARTQGRPAAALDAIALFESGLAELCDVTVAVTASEEVRVGRIMARDGISEEYARMRTGAQKPAQYFEERCDHTLRNDGDDPARLEARALALFKTMFTQGGQ